MLYSLLRFFIMATGIKITKADYGEGSKIVDVRAAVSSHIQNGELNLVVSSDSLGVDDPSPGKTKKLTVSYTVNNGDTNVKAANDNEVIIISAPTATIASGFDITKAQYGYPGNMTDVTDAIRNYVKNGEISLKVSPSSVGIPDPNPNKQKVLEVDYTLNGAKNSESIKDGSTFSVSAPAGENISNNGQGIGEVIYNFILWSMLYTLYFIGIVSAYNYGKLFNEWASYCFAAISLIPFFGFLSICQFALFYQFYAGSKMDIFQNVVVPFRSIPPILPQ